MDNANQPKKYNKRRFLLLVVFLVLSLIFLCISILPGLVYGSNNGFSTIPIQIHSVDEANYSKDARQATIPGIQLDIIKNIISDSGSSIIEIESRLATLTAVLSSPIPSATPLPNQPTKTSLPPLLFSPTTTLELFATSTYTLTPTISNSPTSSNTPSQTNSPTPTKTTDWFYATNTPTRTATRTPSRTPSRTPTRTPTVKLPNTLTNTPTNTPTGTSTSTPTAINHAPTDLILSNTIIAEDQPLNSSIGHLVTVDP